MMKHSLKLLLASIAVTATEGRDPAHLVRRRTIKNGLADDGEHPMVGMMIALNETGLPVWRCSGTLLDEYTFLTAAHCIPEEENIVGGESFGTIESVGISFEEDLSFLPKGSTRFWPPGSLDPVDFDIEATDLRPHPDYNDTTFIGPDIGVVKWSVPYDGTGGEFGLVPTYDLEEDIVDEFKLPDIKFKYVGYGLAKAHPQKEEFDEVPNARLKANGRLISATADPFSAFNFGYEKEIYMWSSINKKGGICYGDSGGPVFLNIDNGYDKFTVAGVISWGTDPGCHAGVASTRTDRPEIKAWLEPLLGSAESI